ncbi:MAG: hemerythrin family protein, partial [Proteobacteria bacterium]|nr:hemerythrin family protein [Pseudomonadota bacterium]
MQIVKWRESYETGVASMDNQHKTLLDLINQLYPIVRDHRGQEEISKIVDACLSYAKKHLGDEEQLLLDNNFPGLQEQLDHHAQFTETVNTFAKQLTDSPDTVVPELYAYLRTWWISHIVGIDKKYGP